MASSSEQPRARRRRDTPFKPTRAELAAARTGAVRDVIGPGLRVLFVGINPGLYSAAIGHHFGRPGNRFWPALHAGGFTPRVLSPFEEARMLDWGWGLTNLVHRPTALAQEVTPEELRTGGARLIRKIRRYRPAFVAPLGVSDPSMPHNSVDGIRPVEPSNKRRHRKSARSVVGGLDS